MLCLPGAVGAALEGRATFLALEQGRSSLRRRYPRMPRALSSLVYFLQGAGGKRMVDGEDWEGYKRVIKRVEEALTVRFTFDLKAI